MLVLCELQCVFFEHVEFNAAFIESIIKSKKYENEKIIFLAEEKHLLNVKKKLSNTKHKIYFEKINVANRNWLNYRRLVTDFFLIKKIIGFCKETEVKKIIFTSVNSSILISLKILLSFDNNTRCLAIIHGVLESIEKRPSLRPWEFFFWFKWAIKYFNRSNLQYIVLGEFIKKTLTKISPELALYVHAIDHPYIFKSEYIRDKQVNKSNTVCFGAIGVGSLQKGTNSFFKLAEELSFDKRNNKEAKFFLVGCIIDSVLKKYKTNKVYCCGNNKEIDRETFEKYLVKLDYAMFFYPPDSYKLTASGAFMDAITWGIPIIALKNPFFEYYFSKMGNIGYLCNDFAEIKKVVKKILEKDFSQKEYLLQRQNILTQREIFSVNTVGNRLRQVLDNNFGGE
ncbi:hypothetical protein [Pectinatus frisingensis]|uniref:hypothetical protein n=1 Tax=Pectinatus frisingensis TaxID=865 RepID=UPI0018C7B6D2|nr:hypothetical protein [Pectinatus frisingensis]